MSYGLAKYLILPMTLFVTWSLIYIYNFFYTLFFIFKIISSTELGKNTPSLPNAVYKSSLFLFIKFWIHIAFLGPSILQNVIIDVDLNDIKIIFLSLKNAYIGMFLSNKNILSLFNINSFKYSF